MSTSIDSARESALKGKAESLRKRMIEVCTKNGGHLGASLGAVELAISLHEIFESPKDRLIWDVGHQAYAHKLLTGRDESFTSLRKKNGIAPFLSRAESEHDVFGAGHSSTSLSAAAGIAAAANAKGDTHWTVAIIGDGALTAGLAWEALNQLSSLHLNRLLIVVNDNGMSISPNVGRLSELFSSQQARPFFEMMGMKYVGPIDGHSFGELFPALEKIKEETEERRPIVLHVKTQKGRGHPSVEFSPDRLHGLSPADKKEPPGAQKGQSFSAVFGESLCALAEKDPRIVVITAAMTEGTGLSEFARKFPDRFYDVGIAEPHAVVFAAGLACQGLVPIVAIYSTFLQRGVDALIHDVALQKLNVKLVVDRAGLVGPDGPTHHGVFDTSFLGMIPGIQLFAPNELSGVTETLQKIIEINGPCAMRFPRGSGPAALPWKKRENGYSELNAPEKIEQIFVAFGHSAMKLPEIAARLGEASQRTLFLGVSQLKPFPQKLLERVRSYPQARLVTLEDGVLRGGQGEALSRESRSGIHLGIPDEFIGHGSVHELELDLGLTPEQIVKRLEQ